jgi:protein-disulfide isomerase
MERYTRSLPRFRNLSLALAAAALAFAGVRAYAQFTPPAQQGTKVHDTSALKPPAGARVAIVEFADMECPECGHSSPVLKEASAKYKIPLIFHDFPLEMHAWSFQAAVNARWFGQKSKALGEQYRDEIFANQPSFGNNPELVARFTQKFAKSHGIDLPFAIDPQGKLAALVKADYALGQKIGIDHTPTIWVVTSGSKGAPFIEVTDRSRLYQIIDQAMADTAGPARKPAKAKK